MCEDDNKVSNINFSQYIGTRKSYNSVMYIRKKLLNLQSEDTVKLNTSKEKKNDKSKNNIKETYEPKRREKLLQKNKEKSTSHDNVVKETIKFARSLVPQLLEDSPKYKRKVNSKSTTKYTGNENSTTFQFAKSCANTKTILLRDMCTQTYYAPKKVFIESTKKEIDNTTIILPNDDYSYDSFVYNSPNTSTKSSCSDRIQRYNTKKQKKRENNTSPDENNQLKLIEMLGTILQSEQINTEIKFTIMNEKEKRQFTDEISSCIVKSIQMKTNEDNMPKIVNNNSKQHEDYMIKTTKSPTSNWKSSRTSKLSLYENDYSSNMELLLEEENSSENLVTKEVTKSKNKTCEQRNVRLVEEIKTLDQFKSRDPITIKTMTPKSKKNLQPLVRVKETHNIGDSMEIQTPSKNSLKVLNMKNIAEEMNHGEVIDYFVDLHNENVEVLQVESVESCNEYDQTTEGPVQSMQDDKDNEKNNQSLPYKSGGVPKRMSCWTPYKI